MGKFLLEGEIMEVVWVEKVQDAASEDSNVPSDFDIFGIQWLCDLGTAS